MVEISELRELEGAPVTIAKQENDRSIKKDSGLEDSSATDQTIEVKSCVSLSSGLNSLTDDCV